MKGYGKSVILLLIVAVLGTTVIPGTKVSGTAASDDKLLEAVQASRNNHLAEEEFMHDFGEKLERQELSMLMITMLEKLSYKGIKDLAQIMKIFYPFDDKPAPSPTYIPYICLANKIGLIDSMTKNKFQPEGLVTRQMFASVLLKAMLLAKPLTVYRIKDDVKFLDDGKIYDWARPGIIFAYKGKYLEATAKNEINPKGYVTREQALDIVYRVLVGEKAITGLTQEEIKRSKGELPLFRIRNRAGKWGYADITGKTIIKPSYDNAKDFSEGRSAVCLNNKWGFIDTAGNLITKLEYDYVHDFHDGLAAAGTSSRYGYIDNTGKLAIQLSYMRDTDFYTGLSDFSNKCTIVKLDRGRYKLIDKSGKAIYKPDIASARPFSEGLAAVAIGSRRGYIDNKGKMVIQLDSQVTAYNDFHDGMAAICINNSIYGYMDKAGRFIIKPQYSYQELKGFVTANNTPAILPDFSEGIVQVSIDRRLVLIDKKGKVITKENPGICSKFNDGAASIKVNGQYGYIDKAGNLMIKPQFQSAGGFHDGLAAVLTGGKYGYINKSGILIINPSYSLASDFVSGLAAVEDSNRNYYLIDKNGKVIYKSD